MTPAALNELVNRQAGLLGVSGTSADMRDLLERESTDGHAAEAVALFCYQAKRYLGALAAAPGRAEHPGLYRRVRGTRRIRPPAHL